jgi:hypothetical protein
LESTLSIEAELAEEEAGGEIFIALLRNIRIDDYERFTQKSISGFEVMIASQIFLGNDRLKKLNARIDRLTEKDSLVTILTLSKTL